MLLVVMGSTMLPVSVLTIWVRNQVLDTDRYLQTVASLSDDMIGRATPSFLESDRFDRLRLETNRVAHDGLVARRRAARGTRCPCQTDWSS